MIKQIKGTKEFLEVSWLSAVIIYFVRRHQIKKLGKQGFEIASSTYTPSEEDLT